jgi:hypothetical protein
VLIPPLIAIIALAFDGVFAAEEMPPIVRKISWTSSRALLIGSLALATIVASIVSDYSYYQMLRTRVGSSATQRMLQIAADLEEATTSDQWIITDAQSTAALANRDTPPWLVDVSNVRIRSGYITTQELLQAASEPRVHAVLFATDRLTSEPVASFHDWVAERFYPLRTYDRGIELWIR